MQAGTGSAGELTPCTTASAPTCPAQERPSRAGPDRLQEARETALGRTRDNPAAKDRHHVPCPWPQFVGLLGAPVCPVGRLQPQGSAGSALLEVFFRPYHLSPSPLLQPQNRIPRLDQRRQEFTLGAPHPRFGLRAEGATQLAPVHLLPCPCYDGRKHRHTHVAGTVHPPPHRPQGPFPRSPLVPGAVMVANPHSGQAKSASRCTAMPTPCSQPHRRAGLFVG